MSPSTSCFSFETSSTTAPFSTVALLHLGSSMVEDTTYLRRPFSLSANAPLRDSHRVANHSSLRRPSSRAWVLRASSSATLAHPSRSLPPNSPNQPPSLKPSLPSGSWTTPSSETFVLITIFPMSVLLGWHCQLHRCRHRDVGNLGARQPPSSAVGRCLYKTCPGGGPGLAGPPGHRPHPPRSTRYPLGSAGGIARPGGRAGHRGFWLRKELGRGRNRLPA